MPVTDRPEEPTRAGEPRSGLRALRRTPSALRGPDDGGQFIERSARLSPGRTQLAQDALDLGQLRQQGVAGVDTSYEVCSWNSMGVPSAPMTVQ
jgi:hypothetical protein